MVTVSEKRFLDEIQIQNQNGSSKSKNWKTIQFFYAVA